MREILFHTYTKPDEHSPPCPPPPPLPSPLPHGNLFLWLVSEGLSVFGTSSFSMLEVPRASDPSNYSQALRTVKIDNVEICFYSYLLTCLKFDNN